MRQADNTYQINTTTVYSKCLTCPGFALTLTKGEMLPWFPTSSLSRKIMISLFARSLQNFPITIKNAPNKRSHKDVT